ncbi:MAG: HAMP domain-containing histidine kinase [Chloroflexi bacterium]|nr:HAMP domain-containing histidine kinase [Chloroflexota bacterium]
MSIRLRLTLWYTAVLCATLIIFTSALYIFLAQYLSQQVDETISMQAQKVADGIVIQRSIMGSPSRVILPPIDEIAVPASLYIQVVDVNGNIVAKSDNLGTRSLPLPASNQAQGSFYETVQVGSNSIRMYGLPLSLNGQVIGTVQVGESLLQTQITLGRLRLLAIFGIAVSALVAGVIGWLLARTALRPIDRITRTAQSIGQSRNLSQRLEVGDRQDELERLSTTFNDMLDQLESAFATQRRFVADASHELRTPLTAIRGNLEILHIVPNLGKDEREEILSDLSREAERMSRLVADLLTLARADGGVAIRQEKVDLAGVVSEAVREARGLAGGAELSVDIKGEAIVLGDNDRLKQLLLILLDNAIKYGGEGAIEVSLSTADSEATITVRDHGGGISQEDLPHVFERFYRAAKSRSREDGGAGLGLAIAKWIAESHGGRIGVESTTGEGSTFQVTLPLHHDIAPAPTEKIQAKPYTVAGS